MRFIAFKSNAEISLGNACEIVECEGLRLDSGGYFRRIPPYRSLHNPDIAVGAVLGGGHTCSRDQDVESDANFLTSRELTALFERSGSPQKDYQLKLLAVHITLALPKPPQSTYGRRPVSQSEMNTSLRLFAAIRNHRAESWRKWGRVVELLNHVEAQNPVVPVPDSANSDAVPDPKFGQLAPQLLGYNCIDGIC